MRHFFKNFIVLTILLPSFACGTKPSSSQLNDSPEHQAKSVRNPLHAEPNGYIFCEGTRSKGTAQQFLKVDLTLALSASGYHVVNARGALFLDADYREKTWEGQLPKFLGKSLEGRVNNYLGTGGLNISIYADDSQLFYAAYDDRKFGWTGSLEVNDLPQEAKADGSNSFDVICSLDVPLPKRELARRVAEQETLRTATSLVQQNINRARSELFEFPTSRIVSQRLIKEVDVAGYIYKHFAAYKVEVTYNLPSDQTYLVFEVELKETERVGGLEIVESKLVKEKYDRQSR